MTTPPDLAALARDLMAEVTGTISHSEWLARAEAKLTLSRTAGRAEGLGEAATWHDAEASRLRSFAERLGTADGGVVAAQRDAAEDAADTHEIAARAIRALASDPAPGEQVAEERRAIADEAGRYAGHYPQASDGRNTFILLAEWIEARGADPAHPTEPGEVERLTHAELNLARQWFNAVQDLSPKYLDKADHDLAAKILAALSTPRPKGETE